MRTIAPGWVYFTMNKTCATCRFWEDRNTIEKSGLCRRHSPVSVEDRHDGMIGVFPITYDEDWCGDYEYRQQLCDNCNSDCRDSIYCDQCGRERNPILPLPPSSSPAPLSPTSETTGDTTP